MDTCCLVNAGEEGGRYKNIDLVVVILFKSNLKKRRHFFFLPKTSIFYVVTFMQ